MLTKVIFKTKLDQQAGKLIINNNFLFIYIQTSLVN